MSFCNSQRVRMCPSLLICKSILLHTLVLRVVAFPVLFSFLFFFVPAAPSFPLPFFFLTKRPFFLFSPFVHPIEINPSFFFVFASFLFVHTPPPRLCPCRRFTLSLSFFFGVHPSLSIYTCVCMRPSCLRDLFALFVLRLISSFAVSNCCLLCGLDFRSRLVFFLFNINRFYLLVLAQFFFVLCACRQLSSVL